jgi:hypothetical protein
MIRNATKTELDIVHAFWQMRYHRRPNWNELEVNLKRTSSPFMYYSDIRKAVVDIWCFPVWAARLGGEE